MSSSNIKWPCTIMILNIWQSEKKRNLWTFKSWTVHRTLQWISSSVVLPLDCTRVDLHSSQFQMIPFILDWTLAQPLNSSCVWIKPSKLAVPDTHAACGWGLCGHSQSPVPKMTIFGVSTLIDIIHLNLRRTPPPKKIKNKKTLNLLFRAIWSLGFWITGIISMLLMFIMSIHHLNCRHITGETGKQKNRLSSKWITPLWHTFVETWNMRANVSQHSWFYRTLEGVRWKRVL